LEYTYYKYDDVYRVTGIGTATATDIVISSVYEGKSVTCIYDNAFDNCSQITGVTIPDSVTRIGSLAFRNCTGLKEITIPQGIISLGYCAFSNSGLTKVYWNATQCKTTFDTGITNGPFENCSEFSEVIIGDNVKSLPKWLFCKAEKLLSVNIPANVESFIEAFDQNLSYVTVDEGNATYASKDGIVYNKAMTEIAFIPYSIKGSVTIPGTVINIKEEQFSGRKGLTEIILEEGIKTIGNRAFAHTSVKKMIIPDSVTTIGEELFYCCSEIRTIIIGSGVKTMGEHIVSSNPMEVVYNNLKIYCKSSGPGSGWKERWNTYITYEGKVYKFKITWNYSA